ncbi:mechanosensitive ion channel [Proteinivorax hydrogeniformans]|uniref:Mechanosensitive ion channel n=1 Tax=Proteinivorax hydrogeniformans TaxID=1826727 RepID=A0AAU8HRY4_9FIRM
MEYLERLFESFISAVPSVIHAALLLVLALVVSAVVKSIVVKLLNKLQLEKHTDKLGVVDEDTGSSVEFIGKLVYIIVFLLFLPEVLNQLGLHDAAQPITMVVSRFLNFIPNIIAASIILVVGIFIAKIIRQLLVPVLKKLNVDKLQEKAGVETSEEAQISSVISYIVYVLILIPVVISALQVLNIAAISDPAIAMLNRIVVFLPNIFVAIAIVVIGVYIAKISGKLLTQVLSSVGTDKLIGKIIPSDDEKISKFSLSTAIGELVKYIVGLLFFVEAINVLRLEVLQTVGQGIIAYLPFAISAIIIMGTALFIATWVEALIGKKAPNAKVTALIAKTTIIVIAVFMALSQLGVASSIVNAAFIITLGALAIAFAISFGIGGREFAANMLKRLEDKTKEDK